MKCAQQHTHRQLGTHTDTQTDIVRYHVQLQITQPWYVYPRKTKPKQIGALQSSVLDLQMPDT